MLKKILILSIISAFVFSGLGMVVSASEPVIQREATRFAPATTFTRAEFVDEFNTTGFAYSRNIEDVRYNTDILTADEFFTRYVGQEFSMPWVMASIFDGTTPFGNGRFSRVYEFALTGNSVGEAMAAPTPAPPTQPTPPAQLPQATRPSQQATPSAVTVMVNGQKVAFQAYNIQGNNFFMLRDLAYSLNGTAAQFNVGWSAADNAIILTGSQAYVVVGGKMTTVSSSARAATPTASRIMLDGSAVMPRGYLIGDNNFFMLRELGDLLGFNVGWDAPSSTILITTGNNGNDETVAEEVRRPEEIGFDFRALYTAGVSVADIQDMFEQEMVRLVNEIRAEHGLAIFTQNQDLAIIARSRTDEMIRYGERVGHVSPTTGLEHTEHARAMGLNVRWASENAGGSPTPQAQIDVWMASASHRDFILGGSSSEFIGIGFSFGGTFGTTARWTLWLSDMQPPR